MISPSMISVWMFFVIGFIYRTRRAKAAYARSPPIYLGAPAFCVSTEPSDSMNLTFLRYHVNAKH